MPFAKKHTSLKKIKATKTVVVTKKETPTTEALFPEKVAKVNALLAKSSLLHS
jgi:hypothetical protein